MLILITIFLLLFIPGVMLILYLVRPRFNFQGFLAVAMVLAAWVLVFLARPGISITLALPQWQPAALFTLSPALLVDHSSWYFALALVTLALAVVITSITQLGQIPDHSLVADHVPASVDQPIASATIGSAPPGVIAEAEGKPGWSLWASCLALTSFGLLAVTAGNLLTLLLAWTALDLLELVILLGQMVQSVTRERIMLSFSAKLAGTCLVIGAGVMLWSGGSPLNFESIGKPVATLLLLAAGLRLGVIPIHLPFTRGLPINRNLATMLRLVPAAASYILLVRLASSGVVDTLASYLLALTILSGIYAGINWLRSRDEVAGRPFWLLATASLVVAAAILEQPAACLAWGIASMLSGGLVFSMSLRHKNLLALVVLGLINLTALPFTPTWRGTAIFDPSAISGLNPTILAIFSFLLLLTQAFILAGYIRHISRGNYQVSDAASPRAERWVWFLYPLGLGFIVATHILIGIFMLPGLTGVPALAWFAGGVAVLFVGVIHFFGRQYRHLFQPRFNPNIRTAWDRLFAFEWLYRSLWRAFRYSSRVFGLLSSILEGEGGLLWALVLFGLIFVFLQR